MRKVDRIDDARVVRSSDVVAFAVADIKRPHDIKSQRLLNRLRINARLNLARMKGIARRKLMTCGNRPLVVNDDRVAVSVDIDAIDFSHQIDASVFRLTVGVFITRQSNDVLEITRLERREQRSIVIKEVGDLAFEGIHSTLLKPPTGNKPVRPRLHFKLFGFKPIEHMPHQLTGLFKIASVNL